MLPEECCVSYWINYFQILYSSEGYTTSHMDVFPEFTILIYLRYITVPD